MTAVAEKITKPGIYPGVPDEVYHADPVEGGSLSSTGAREVLVCPAKYRWGQDNPRPPKREFDLGHAGHHMVLGVGARIEKIEAANYRTDKAKAQRDAAYDAGAVPVLPHELEQVKAMAAAVHAHPTAGPLLRNALHFELTLVWRNVQSGVMCRARIDCLSRAANGRILVVDYKTAASSEPEAIRKAIATYGYHQQFDFYIDGVMELGISRNPLPLLIVQEKTPPYVVTVAQVQESALDIAAVKNAKALDRYAECTRTGRWPGYADDIVGAPLPAYEEKRFAEEMDRDVYKIKGKQAA